MPKHIEDPIFAIRHDVSAAFIYLNHLIVHLVNEALIVPKLCDKAKPFGTVYISSGVVLHRPLGALWIIWRERHAKHRLRCSRKSETFHFSLTAIGSHDLYVMNAVF